MSRQKLEKSRARKRLSAKVPVFTETLKQAKETGNLKIYACRMVMDMLGLKRRLLSSDASSAKDVLEWVKRARRVEVKKEGDYWRTVVKKLR